jgi:hypothetical protein
MGIVLWLPRWSVAGRPWTRVLIGPSWRHSSGVRRRMTRTLVLLNRNGLGGHAMVVGHFNEPKACSMRRRLPMRGEASFQGATSTMTSNKMRLFLIILLLGGCSNEPARPPSASRHIRTPPYRMAGMTSIPKRALDECSPEHWVECLPQQSHVSEARPTILLQSLDPSIFDQRRFAPGTWNEYP